MKLCLRCATINSHTAATCVRCGAVYDLNYDTLLHKTKNYAKYGVDYRIRYEAQLHYHGGIVEKYSLSPPEWLIFASIAALSGIIGNVAYDTAKAIIRKIVEQLPKSKVDDFSNGYHKYELKLETSEDIERFIQYLKEYHNDHDISNAHPIIGHAIREEKNADKAGSYAQVALAKMLHKAKYFEDEKEATKRIAEAKRRRSELEQDLEQDLFQSDFEGLWSRIDNDDIFWYRFDNDDKKEH